MIPNPVKFSVGVLGIEPSVSASPPALALSETGELNPVPLGPEPSVLPMN